ncbi:MAG: YgeY family selenium metabolism-linked hydrolase [Cetobacterium sp.]|uniref:YgeY family selenium metabolism-linked hydrolase n=1 Tax=Cetobacterium sp. TaxID=2071632 RepID=UPI002FCA5326
MFSKEREEQLIKLCQDLIKAPSYSGQEGEVAQVIEKAFKKLGFDECFVDVYGNIIGKIQGKHPGKKILFDGHIDTVPVPDASKWTYGPFDATIADGKLYGRGTSDMKGQVGAMISACAYFAEDCKKDFAGEIYVAGVVHEECFEGIAARKISEAVKPDYVVIGECSELNLKIGQRGRGEIVVETFGKPAHSANPDKGINAVYKMATVIQEINKLEAPVHPVLGKGILELVDIKSSPYPGASVVPEYCRSTYDRRLLVEETMESVIEPLQRLAERLMKEDPQMKIKVSYSTGKEMCYTGNVIEGERFFPGWLYEKDDEFTKIAYEGLKSVGLNPEITQYSFCTNGSHYAGEAKIPTIGFGPSRENLAHTIDEHIEISQLIKGTEGYYGILKSLYKR